ncbi:MAG: lysylphosphatidylglycerol synthase domain-containing protein [Nostocaceae cyanobacterium]|nr:lysylphosphatidylglycerol synthase domain-containing protein [Nostocaceae cyanobacterium]
MKQIISQLKVVIRWIIFGGILFFLVTALKNHYSEVAAIRIDGIGWAILTIALGITLLAHTWAGWIWTWILQDLNQSVNSGKFIQTYLKTNIAKYLPGNVWHFYGRILAANKAGVSGGIAFYSVLLEPLLMAAAALIFVLFNSLFVGANTLFTLIIQILCLLMVLIVVHPWFLNPATRFLSRLKLKSSNRKTLEPAAVNIRRYPLRPLLGELGFLLLRGIGFVLTVFAFQDLEWQYIPVLLSAFSLAWLLGLVVPGAPGGIGVFEATALALLQARFSPAIIISAIAVYRLISIIAETAGAALAWLDEQIN